MALINPSTLYSGGNVRLDNTPYLRLAMQERTRKALRGQAIDQYYQKLPETINDKGVRDQEIPLIADIKNRMTETYLNNRDAIQKGDPAAVLKMQQLLREGLAITRGSQNASKIDIKLGSLAVDPKNQPILNNDGFIERHTLHNLPVNDPNHKPLDIAQELADRPFDQQSYSKELKATVPYSQSTPIVTQHPTDKTLEVVTINPVLSDETKQNLYERSAYKLHNDIAFQKQLKKDFSTPEQLAQLNEVSKKVFGHEIQEPEDIAAAYSASLLPTSSTRQSVRASMEANNAEWDRRNAITNRQRKEAAALHSAKADARLDKMMSGTESVGYPLDDVVDELAIEHEIKSAEGGSMGTQKRVYRKDIPVGEFDLYSPKDARVRGYKDVQTGEEYYLPTTDANGHKQLVGEGGKIIGAEVARQNTINKAIPSNKAKQGIYFNKGKVENKKGKYD